MDHSYAAYTQVHQQIQGYSVYTFVSVRSILKSRNPKTDFLLHRHGQPAGDHQGEGHQRRATLLHQQAPSNAGQYSQNQMEAAMSVHNFSPRRW